MNDSKITRSQKTYPPTYTAPYTEVYNASVKASKMHKGEKSNEGLYYQYYYLVYEVFFKLRKNYKTDIYKQNDDNLIEAGFNILKKAIQKNDYDPKKGTKKETYYSKIIKNKIIDEIKSYSRKVKSHVEYEEKQKSIFKENEPRNILEMYNTKGQRALKWRILDVLKKDQQITGLEKKIAIYSFLHIEQIKGIYPYRRIGNVIYMNKRRCIHKYTQNYIANKLNVSQSTISIVMKKVIKLSKPILEEIRKGMESFEECECYDVLPNMEDDFPLQ